MILIFNMNVSINKPWTWTLDIKLGFLFKLADVGVFTSRRPCSGSKTRRSPWTSTHGFSAWRECYGRCYCQHTAIPKKRTHTASSAHVSTYVTHATHVTPHGTLHQVHTWRMPPTWPPMARVVPQPADQAWVPGHEVHQLLHGLPRPGERSRWRQRQGR